MTTLTSIIDVRDFGADPELADNSSAIRNAIAASRLSGAPGTVYFHDRYVCDQPFWDDELYGIRLLGNIRGHNTGGQHSVGGGIHYVGAGAAMTLNIRAGQNTGGVYFQDMHYTCDNPAATFFNLNPNSVGGLLDVGFYGCVIWGANGKEQQQGDGIRMGLGNGLFIDKHTHIRGWRYGLHLNGCDDARIDGRFLANVQQVRTSVNQNWNANLQINSNWMGFLELENDETSCHLWLDRCTANVGPIGLEGPMDVGVYYNGRQYYDRVTWGCSTSAKPYNTILEVGPYASGTMIAPLLCGEHDDIQIKIDEPEDQQSYWGCGSRCVFVHDPSVNLLGQFRHDRIVVK